MPRWARSMVSVVRAELVLNEEWTGGRGRDSGDVCRIAAFKRQDQDDTPLALSPSDMPDPELSTFSRQGRALSSPSGRAQGQNDSVLY